jgi:hypothetical protein
VDEMSEHENMGGGPMFAILRGVRGAVVGSNERGVGMMAVGAQQETPTPAHVWELGGGFVVTVNNSTMTWLSEKHLPWLAFGSKEVDLLLPSMMTATTKEK